MATIPLSRYPQCPDCEHADYERLGAPKCKIDKKPIRCNTQTSGMCQNYNIKEDKGLRRAQLAQLALDLELAQIAQAEQEGR